MIVGVILRYIKTYKGINYIPLTEGSNFCGLVGDNGIGKSSVLEALDSFFNERPITLNIAVKRSGYTETKPSIVPVFLVKKSNIPEPLTALAEKLSQLALSISEADVNPANRQHIKRFVTHRESLLRNIKISDHYLMPIGVDHNSNPTLSVFNCRKLVEITHGEQADSQLINLNDAEVSEFSPLLRELKNSIEYIYIPKDIDSESFTKLETIEIQALMGETLNEILERCVTTQAIQSINRSLNDFIDGLSQELIEYSYRTPTDRQQNLKKQDVYNLITQAFFNIRKLHKKQGESWLEINALSSGEKQKAIIDVAHSLIKNHRTSGHNLVLAIDEPESSLHMSACFDQFDALHDISRSCMQLLFSTHWYGFFSTIEDGSATVITKRDGDHFFDLIDLPSHREQVKQLTSSSRGKLPYDIRLKSINDFVQSVISSTIGDNPYSWVLCEGSSEKIYLSAYFKEIISNRRVRVVPVGGAKEIKRIYQHLAVSYEEFKDEINGKIVLISDTDAELVLYETTNYSNLICKRLVSDSKTKEARLVNISSNPVSPKTEIEDALNGKLFYETLNEFSVEIDNQDLCNLFDSATENNSYFALDLRSSEREAIEVFFNNANNKYVFAQRYIARLTNDHRTPTWISDIKGWIS
ncbi:ATP-dependent nuclease [Stutzerimonas nitrititolerans]|uniref:ATP-dependent nuclease n=1 Tax=Stutzerimonas nitrititolerans TaxID=2482751 RepID=UPI0028A18B44|nr:AAA family ATPase [Stutzerimonas nitrititolerans]